ncbi:MAG: hypothetical protein ACREBO_14080 [Novosphingobium sp.]
MASFIASESAPVGETDLLRNKSYRTSVIDRVIEDVGIFVATLANMTKFVLKVGQQIEVDLDAADGTVIDASKLHDVSIDVPAGATIQALVTIATAATVSQCVLNIEGVE